MGRTLARAVAVFGPDGAPHTFKAGDEAPEWLEAKVTNPAIWGDDAEEVVPRSKPTDPDVEHPRSQTEHERRGVGKQPDDDEEDESSGLSTLEPGEVPPRQGPNATRDAWVAYAEDNEVGVTKSMTRDDIIRALKLAEVPTE